MIVKISKAIKFVWFKHTFFLHILDKYPNPQRWKKLTKLRWQNFKSEKFAKNAQNLAKICKNAKICTKNGKNL